MISSPRFAQLAFVVALAVMLRFAAVEVHYALEHHHGPDQQCEICLVSERSGTGPPCVAGKLVVAPDWPAPLARGSGYIGTSPEPCPPARGPPALFA